MPQEIILSPQDEQDFQDSFPQYAQNKDEDSDLVVSPDESVIERNSKIITKIDSMTIERLDNDDAEPITFKDLIAIKSEAHKQIQSEKGIADPTAGPRLIPAIINIQVINN